jgi:hypothetical protein
VLVLAAAAAWGFVIEWVATPCAGAGAEFSAPPCHVETGNAVQLGVGLLGAAAAVGAALAGFGHAVTGQRRWLDLLLRGCLLAVVLAILWAVALAALPISFGVEGD